MKFEVPQFIDMEDKIFGPLSFKEFIYVLGGIGISYILYRFIPYIYLAFLFIIPVMSFSIALAFYKPNNKPFIDMVESALIFFLGKKLYIWKKKDKIKTGTDVDASVPPSLVHTDVQNISEERISNTSREININIDEKSLKKDVNSKLNIKI